MRKYYSLILRQNKTSPWCVEFGDYDKALVEFEMDDYFQHGKKKINMRIICTESTQEAINTEVNAWNNGERK